MTLPSPQYTLPSVRHPARQLDDVCLIFLVYHPATVDEWWNVDRVTVDMLPDVALLKIFDCYVNQARKEEGPGLEHKIQEWHTLVHVCRQWRTIVLGSPCRLGLRLLCTDRTPVKETLAVWPPLPIVIDQFKPTQMENIIGALEHNERICQIDLFVTNSQLEEVLAAMQQPFPALTDLKIMLDNEMPPVDPESFLGGSAPRLQHLDLTCIPFPGLPKILLSTTDLVSLHIWGSPHSGYISPEAMASCLSTLTRLEVLWLGFESPLSRPVRLTRRPHPPTRSTLPALTYFWFRGVSEYLEDLVARVNAPLLENVRIAFFQQLIFDTPQLAQFLARTPNFQSPVGVDILFQNDHIVVFSSDSRQGLRRGFQLEVSCKQSDWQLSSLAQVCTSSIPRVLIRMVEHLDIFEDTRKYEPLDWPDDIEGSQWLEVLRPFTALKDLYISGEFLPRIAPALQELAGEHLKEVLPVLESISLPFNPSGPALAAVEEFVAARLLAGHHITVSH